MKLSERLPEGPWWVDDDGFIAAGHDETYVTVADVDVNDLDINVRELVKDAIVQTPSMVKLLEWIVGGLPIEYVKEEAINILSRISGARLLSSKL